MHERGLFWYVGMDFRAWWGAAHVVREQGFAHLYDPQALRQVQLQLDPFGQGPRLFEVLPFAYLPVFVLPLLPLAWLPPLAGYALFLSVNAALIVWPLRRLAREFDWGPGWTLTLCSLPVFLDLFYAQTSGLLVLVGVQFLLCLRRGRPLQAGCWLSLWLLKPQNFVVLGLGLVLGPRVRLGMLGGAATLLGSSLALGGLQGYLDLLAHYGSDYGSYPESMQNWRMVGFHLGFAYSRAVTVPIAAGMAFTLLALVALWRYRPRVELLYLGTVAGSLALSWHSHIHTACALLPALVAARPSRALLATWALAPALLFTSLEFLLPVSMASHHVAATLLLLGNLGWLAWSLRGCPVRWHDGRDAGLMFAALLAAHLWVHFPRPEPELLRFGWEHGNIAAALATGWGFADAMGTGSGPTAWMPPLLPGLYALAFRLFGVRTPEAAGALVVVKCAALALAFYWQRRLLARSPWPERRGWLTAVWIAYLLLDRTWVLGDLLDTWLTLFLSSLALLALASNGWALPLGTGLLLPLGSPPLAAGYALLWAVRAWRSQPRLRAIAVCGCVLLAAEAWTTRNALVVGRPYPVKSNLAYDFVQAQELDDDGVITGSTMFTQHPCNAGNSQYQLYRQVGERGFLDECARRAAQPPPDYWLRLARRCRNAFLYLRRSHDLVGVADTLSPSDEALLQRQRVFGHDEYGLDLWLFLEEPPESFARRAHNWPFRDRNAVMRSRWEAAAGYDGLARTPESYLYGLGHALLPTLALVWGLAKRQRHPFFLEAVALYLVYLGPYLLVSHYDRYQTAAFGLQAWIIVLGTAGKRDPLAGTEVPDGVLGL